MVTKERKGRPLWISFMVQACDDRAIGRRGKLLQERGVQASGIFSAACGDGQLLTGHSLSFRNNTVSFLLSSPSVIW